MRVRFPHFIEARRRRRRRLVGALLVGAVLAGAAASSSFAVTETPAEKRDAAIRELVAAAFPADIEPRDMILGAPGSVIAASLDESAPMPGSDLPSKDLRAINRWRANPPAWESTKARLVASGAISAADAADTGRWMPKITKFVVPKSLGGKGLLPGPLGLPMYLRDGLIVPGLAWASGQSVDDVNGQIADQYCTRSGNVITDGLGSVLGTGSCSDWRLSRDYEDDLKRDLRIKGRVCDGSYCVDVETRGQSEAATKAGYTVTNQHRSNIEVCSIRKGTPAAGRYYTLMFDVLTDRAGLIQSPSGGGSGFNFNDECVHPDGGAGVGYVDVQSQHSGKIQVQASGMHFLRNGVEVDSLEAGSIGGFPSQWVTRINCADGTSRFALSASFEGVPGGMAVGPASLALGNCVPASVGIGIQVPGSGSGGSSIDTGTNNVEQPMKEWLTGDPKCLRGDCTLILKKDVGSRMLNCFDFPDECIQWWSDEAAHGPGIYKCYYNGAVVPLKECNVYKRVFDRKNVQQQRGYGDPVTGDPCTKKCNTGVGNGDLDDAVKNPDSSRSCMPSGWGVFNPVEWILKPMKCALEWAFVPRPSKLASVGDKLQVLVANSGPGRAIEKVKAWGSVVPAASGCEGPPVNFSFMGVHVNSHPFSACSGALAQASSMTKLALNISFILMGLAAITRYIARVFGYGGIGEGSTS